MSDLISHIRQSVIGANQSITTPFGERPLTYADYTASGRALGFIEDYLQRSVLPYYANTHTETSFTGAQISALREEARATIRRAVGGGEQDRVIFCGSGATAAINRFIDLLNLRLPKDLDAAHALGDNIPAASRPVVFIGPYEHHSNELPWRESIADVVVIPQTPEGVIDQRVLAAQLEHYAARPLKIGSFSAASNVTGIRSDVAAISRLLKSHGALSCWDYAAAAPYVAIDMNGDAPIDAVFISPHKFVGGPGTPGVLVVKQPVLKNQVPVVVGGGTVSYVTPEHHTYVADVERREEGGTPAIVEAIRAGLVFKLQAMVGLEEIERRECDFAGRAMQRLRAMPNVEVLGNPDAPRLSIFSLRFKHGERDLHYGFVVSLLNDLFGIQVRGGCSCAGPYAHALLGLSREHSRALEAQMNRGSALLRPGWVRLNFNYFIGEAEFQFLLDALELVAEHGWRLLPFYQFDPARGVWRYQGRAVDLPSSLATFDPLQTAVSMPVQGHPDYTAILDAARSRLVGTSLERYSLALEPEARELCWFVLPQDVA